MAAENTTRPTASAPGEACAPGTAYFTLTQGLRSFYGARGMWIDSEPRGALAGMLGPRAPWCSASGPVFWVTSAQIIELMHDIRDNGSRGMNHWQIAQTLRRLREAATRAGTPVSKAVSRGAQPNPDAADISPVAQPFRPLVCPPESKQRERAAFNRHAWNSLREAIDFSQQSVYSQGGTL